MGLCNISQSFSLRAMQDRQMDPDLIDPNLVFAKTASGEEAVLQRTRVVQRNIRMVLILVDGNATVAELCEKTGNPQMTRSALLELENDGLVERRAAVDSVWRSDRPSWRGASDEITAPVSEFSSFGGSQQTPPASSSPRLDETGPNVDALQDQHVERAQPEGKLRVVYDAAPSESGTVFFPRAQEAVAVAAEPADGAAARPARLIDRWRSFWSKADEPLPPVQTAGPRPRLLLTWPLVVVLVLLLPLVFLLLLVLIFPYLNYRPVAEAALGQSIGRKASVDSLGIDVFPKPGLLLNGVSVPAAAGDSVLAIGQIRLQPVLTTLFADKMMFHDVELSDLVLTPAAITDLAQMLGSAARPSARGGPRHVSIEHVEIALAGLGIGDLRGEIALSPEGLLQAVSLHSANRDLTFDARPLATGLSIRIEGLNWHPNTKNSQLGIESFLVQGEWRATTLVAERLEFRVFDGLLTGKATLRTGAEPLLSGDLAFERINARKLADVLDVGVGFLGEGAGRLKFSAAADTWPSLLATLRGEGAFTVKRGSLPGIDLPEALRRAPTVPLALGGATRFEQLSGVVSLTPGFFHFSRLNLSAGAMQSTGYIDIARDLDVRGRMEVQMRGRADHVQMPVLIGGSLKAPLLKAADR